MEVLRENRRRPSREIVEALYQSVRQFSENSPQLDDVTAIVMKVLPA
jgi:serine phosphatase RsbU (regulator of sigma subunit)